METWQSVCSVISLRIWRSHCRCVAEHTTLPNYGSGRRGVQVLGMQAGVWPDSGRLCPKSCKFPRTRAHVSRHRAQILPTAKVARNRPNLGRLRDGCWAEVGQLRPNSARGSPRLARSWSTLARNRPDSARGRPCSARDCTVLAKLGPKSAKFVRRRGKL